MFGWTARIRPTRTSGSGRIPKRMAPISTCPSWLFFWSCGGWSAISPENRDPLFRIALKNLKIRTGPRPHTWPQKGSPAKRTGHTLRVAAQYIQKTPKINGLFGNWLADLGRKAASIALFWVGIDPPQNLVEMGFDRLVAAAGPVPQHIGVPDQDRAAPGLQRPLRLEDLYDPAGVGTADAEQGRQLLMVTGAPNPTLGRRCGSLWTRDPRCGLRC